MCHRIAQGTRWTSCGHFQRHRVLAIADCNKANCEKSIRHPPRNKCKSCSGRTCVTTYDREIQEDVDSVDDFCYACRAAKAKAEGVALESYIGKSPPKTQRSVSLTPSP